jgi:hypothetical protein
MQSVHTRILVYSGDVSLTTTAMTTTVPTSDIQKKNSTPKKIYSCNLSENNILVKLLVLYHTYIICSNIIRAIIKIK